MSVERQPDATRERTPLLRIRRELGRGFCRRIAGDDLVAGAQLLGDVGRAQRVDERLAEARRSDRERRAAPTGRA